MEGRGGDFRERRFSLAAALMALTPVFLVEVPQTGADWSVTFYILAALLTTAGGRRGARLMVLAGILAGMAAACRHQGLGYALVLIPAAGIWTDLRARRTGSLRAWFIFTAAALLTASPWYVKNLIQTGDPLYPLFASLAGKMTYGVGFVDSFTGSRPLHLLWSWALVPFQSAFDPLSLSMTATTGVLSLVLVMLLPALKGKRMGSGYPLLWVVLAFFAWHMTFRTFRYIMPVMAVAWLWLGAALAAVLEKNGVRERALRYAVCLALAVNGATFLALTDYVNRSVAPALGVLSPERYLRETYEVYPAIDHLNSLEPSPGRVLFVGEMRGFYSGFPREVPSHNAPNRLFEMIKEGRSSAAVSLELRKRGFTHILFNPSELERMAWGNRNAPLWRLDEGQKTRLLSFFRERTDTLYSANGVSVHRIFDE